MQFSNDVSIIEERNEDAGGLSSTKVLKQTNKLDSEPSSPELQRQSKVFYQENPNSGVTVEIIGGEKVVAPKEGKFRMNLVKVSEFGAKGEQVQVSVQSESGDQKKDSRI